MYYEPHTLLVKRQSKVRDEFNRLISTREDWVYVTKCRMDDSDVREMEIAENRVFRPSYKIVCPKGIDILCGEIVRVMDGEYIRGEGEVKKITSLNWYDYCTIWI